MGDGQNRDTNPVPTNRNANNLATSLVFLKYAEVV